MAAFLPDARRDVLEHCVRRFGERSEELRWPCASRPGKPIRDARGEVTRLVDTFRIAAGEATRSAARCWNRDLPAHPRLPRDDQAGAGRRLQLHHPFNFPLNLVAHKVAPAIAAAPVRARRRRKPCCALIIGEVLAETDLPAGAFSILPCSNEDAAALTSDERIACSVSPAAWSAGS